MDEDTVAAAPVALAEVNLLAVAYPEGAKSADSMQQLVEAGVDFRVLKPGDMVEGKLISVGKNEVYLDLEGYGIGVVRGRELYDDEATLNSMKPGDPLFASVVESENKDGIVELSLRQAGHERVWMKLKGLLDSKDIVHTKIMEANKGGLMVEVNGVTGFLPVSQLSLEHYPRVEDGDKNKILTALQQYVGTFFDVQIITADPEEEKLIVSEKAVFEKQVEQRLSLMKIGQVVTGTVTGVVDFGCFVKFGDLEGLVHISEMAWQRIENPRDLVRVGQQVQCKVISIDKNRVSLSMKQLQPDPWIEAVKKYTVGQVVKGKAVKVMAFGVFVELDADIQGLCHVMELSHDAIKSAEEVIKPGQEKEFKIISIDPAEHRLGLSLKALTEKPKKAEKETEAPAAFEELPATEQAPSSKAVEAEAKIENAEATAESTPATEVTEEVAE